MNKNQTQIYLLIFLILILFAINYPILDSMTENFLTGDSIFKHLETVKVQRVIDGDTIVVGNGTSVRLLGINSPERGDKCDFSWGRYVSKETSVRVCSEGYEGVKCAACSSGYYRDSMFRCNECIGW